MFSTLLPFDCNTDCEMLQLFPNKGFCDATVTHDVLRWQVYAYSVEFGRQLGKWQPHDDAVSGLQLMHEDRLATASWDCAIKLWQ